MKNQSRNARPAHAAAPVSDPQAIYVLNLKEGEIVWLHPFVEGKIKEPRQRVRLLNDVVAGDDTAMGELVEPNGDKYDDGIREFIINQIEGRSS